MFKAIFTAIRNFFFGTETVVTKIVTETVTETITETVVTETVAATRTRKHTRKAPAAVLRLALDVEARPENKWRGGSTHTSARCADCRKQKTKVGLPKWTDLEARKGDKNKSRNMKGQALVCPACYKARYARAWYAITHRELIKGVGQAVLDALATQWPDRAEGIRGIKPVRIARSTQVLGQGASQVSWPEWFHEETTFKAVCEAAGATPADLQAGILPVAGYKALRANKDKTFIVGEEGATIVKLPASPKVVGVLEACGAKPESIWEFQNRGAKTQDVTYFVSNECLPLVQIGNWGQAHYRSCQAWDQRNKRYSYRGAIALKCFGYLKDPNVFVAWAGGAQDMITRVICRKMTATRGWTVPAGTPVIVMDRWYGDAGYVDSLKSHLKAWAEAQGFFLAQGGKFTDETNGAAEAPAYELGAYRIVPYLDYGYALSEEGDPFPGELPSRPSAYSPWTKARICSYFTLVSALPAKEEQICVDIGSSNGDI